MSSCSNTGSLYSPAVVSAEGVAGGGLLGGHHCLPRFQWTYSTGRLKAPFQANIHIFSCGYLDSRCPVGASHHHRPRSQHPVPQSIPLSQAAGRGRPPCSCSGCKSNPLPGLPTW